METRTKLAIIMTLLVLAMGTAVVVSYMVEKKEPSKKVMQLKDYYKIGENEALLIMDGAVNESNALWFEGHPYLDMATVTARFNHRFYWDETENVMVLTNPTDTIKLKPDKKDYSINKKTKTSDYPIVTKVDKNIYIALEFVGKHADLTYQIYNEPNRVIIQNKWGDYLYSDVEAATQIRAGNDIKEDILKEVSPGERLMYIDDAETKQNDFVKVMTEDGVRGYALKEHLTPSYQYKTKSTYKAPKYTSLTQDKVIYLGWQLLYTADNISNLNSALSKASSLNVIAPTWFYLISTEGEHLTYANSDYVAKAHERGIQVWATYKNDSLEGKFNGSEDSFKLLSSTKSREKLIDNIMASVEEYNLDGVNIDYEMLTKDTGPHFIQFLRELSVQCRNNKVVLSVDNYVPAPYNAFYDLKEQGIIADYVVIMAYDEHYAGSPEAGSVSSYSFFKAAIEDTLKMVPEEKVIIGVPFYTRLWKEVVKDGTTSVTVEANPNMDAAEETLKNNGVTPTWDEETKQYYGEYTKKEARYRIWLEEEKSLTAKVKLIKKNKLAGVAAWKLGDERAGIWEMIQGILE